MRYILELYACFYYHCMVILGSILVLHLLILLVFPQGRQVVIDFMCRLCLKYKPVIVWLFSAIRTIVLGYIFMRLLALVHPDLPFYVSCVFMLWGLTFLIKLALRYLKPEPPIISYVGIFNKLFSSLLKKYNQPHKLGEACLQVFLVLQFVLFYFSFRTVLGRVTFICLFSSIGAVLYFMPTWCFYTLIFCIGFNQINAYLLRIIMHYSEISRNLLLEILGEPAFTIYIGHNPGSKVALATKVASYPNGVFALIGLKLTLDYMETSQKNQQEWIDRKMDEFIKQNPNATATEQTVHLDTLKNSNSIVSARLDTGGNHTHTHKLALPRIIPTTGSITNGVLFVKDTVRNIFRGPKTD